MRRARALLLVALAALMALSFARRAAAQTAAPISAAKARKVNKAKRPKPKRPAPPPKPADEVTEQENPYRAGEAAAPAEVGVEGESPAPSPEDHAPTGEGATEPETATEAPDDDETGIGPIGGKAFLYARAPVLDSPQQLSASLWLSVKPKMSKATYAKLTLSGDVLHSKSLNEWVRGRVREGYLGLRAAGWDIRVGQQVVAWGSSDFVNPTDLVGARDYAFFSTDPEVSRLGSVSAFVAYAPADTGLEMTVVATPFFPETKVIVPPSMIPQGIVLADPVRPGARLDRTELAAKIKYGGSGWDVALVGFHGFDHVPHFEPGAIDPTRGLVVERRYHRQSALGLDGSASMGEWIARFEGAFVLTGNPDQQERFAPPSYTTGVVGLERPLFERVRVMAQVIGRLHYPTFESGRPPSTSTDPAVLQREAIERSIHAANALLFNSQDILRVATTLRVSYDSEDERWQAEVAGMVNWMGGDFATRALVGHRVTDALLVQAGYEAFVGDPSRPFGALRRFSGAFVQGTLTF